MPRQRIQSLELWIVLILPWLLEALGQTQVFSTLWGSLLWGLMIAGASSRVSTLDPRLRRIEGFVLWIGCGLWVTYWLTAWHLGLNETQALVAQSRSREQSWLIRSHAALLASGVGTMMVHWILLSLGWAQAHHLRLDSWARRRLSLTLPSFESLVKGTRRSSLVAFVLWASGFVMALVAGAQSWQRFNSLDWILDSKVLASATLFVLIGWSFQQSHRPYTTSSQWMRRWLYASAFLLVFLVYFLIGGGSGLHEPVSWFLK